jgi:hypothetical protein
MISGHFSGGCHGHRVDPGHPCLLQGPYVRRDKWSTAQCFFADIDRVRLLDELREGARVTSVVWG